MVVGGCLWRSDLDRELTWQIKQVVSEAQNFTSILPSLRPPSRRLTSSSVSSFTYRKTCLLDIPVRVTNSSIVTRGSLEMRLRIASNALVPPWLHTLQEWRSSNMFLIYEFIPNLH